MPYRIERLTNWTRLLLKKGSLAMKSASGRSCAIIPECRADLPAGGGILHGNLQPHRPGRQLRLSDCNLGTHCIGWVLLHTRNGERALEICFRLRRTQLRQLERDFAGYAMDFSLVPTFIFCF